MKLILKISFAAAALAITSPALAWTTWPDVDFEWYASVGRPAPATYEIQPAPRAGYIWSPSRLEWTGTHHVVMPGVWIADDYDRQWRAHADGKVIPLNADAYPIGTIRR